MTDYDMIRRALGTSAPRPDRACTPATRKVREVTAPTCGDCGRTGLLSAGLCAGCRRNAPTPGGLGPNDRQECGPGQVGPRIRHRAHGHACAPCGVEGAVPEATWRRREEAA